MVNSLYGQISAKSRDSVCILSPGGVEWELQVSATTASRLPALGEDIRIFCYLHHREDQMELFGFADENERRLFRDLIKVSGVGPRQAMKILSGILVEQFVRFLEAGDLKALTSIPGLGKTTAQKVVLALKGRLEFVEAEEPGPWDDIVRALVEMGFDKKKAAGAVDTAAGETGSSDGNREEREKEIMKAAIVRLSS